MLAEECHSRIQDLIVQKSVVTLAELAALFETSEMTVRYGTGCTGGAGRLSPHPRRRDEPAPAGQPQLCLSHFFSRAQARTREEHGVTRAALAFVQAGDHRRSGLRYDDDDVG